MASARSAKTAAKFAPTAWSGVAPAASSARVASSADCWTAPSSSIWRPGRFCVWITSSSAVTEVAVALDCSATTPPCAASVRSEVAS